jgi:hypothetical protein
MTTKHTPGPGKTRKPRRIEPYTPAWERLANAEARCFCPRIYPCGECGGPVVDGYCCNRCGSSEPQARGEA